MLVKFVEVLFVKIVFAEVFFVETGFLPFITLSHITTEYPVKAPQYLPTYSSYTLYYQTYIHMFC